MKKTVLLTLSFLFCLQAHAAAGFRDIIQKQCVDSNGAVIADAEFNYSKVMFADVASILGFLTSVDNCNTADFVVYTMTGYTQVNADTVTQAIPAGLETTTKNCRGEIVKSNKTVFQNALISKDKIILKTEKCQELTLSLQPEPEEK